MAIHDRRYRSGLLRFIRTRLSFQARTKHFINVFGEEVIVDNADKALRIACDKTGAEITDYTAAPVYMSDEQQGAHEWLIEFANPPADLDYFTTLLDHALMSINSDYEAKRYRNLTLDKPIVHQAKRELSTSGLQEKGKLGGQNKVPRLSNERKYLEELLESIHAEPQKIVNFIQLTLYEYAHSGCRQYRLGKNNTDQPACPNILAGMPIMKMWMTILTSMIFIMICSVVV